MHILSLVPLSSSVQAEITGLDPSIRLTLAPGHFDGEIRETWGSYVADSYLPPGSTGVGRRADRDRLLADAEVILCGFPVPVDLAARAPSLQWLHQTPAGASNLHRCDLWGGEVPVTTSRGLGNTRAIAEYVVASFLYFSRSLHRATQEQALGRLDRLAHRPVLAAGKTACVIGAGGIGREVGQLCSAIGMRVVGTRRHAAEVPPDGFDLVTGPERLPELLAESALVAVCCQWTPETERLIGAETLAAMQDGSVLVNIARGEIIDEEALVGHLDRLGGVALDVYVGEFDRPPPASLWGHPNVLITPHTSAGADDRSRRPIDLFCRNLRALLAGDPLENVIDWDRGY